jgi:hypothetical protein
MSKANAVTKQFIEQVGSLNRQSSGIASKAQELGIVAVQKAYGGDNVSFAQYLLDNTPKFVQVALSRWFTRAGLDVIAPKAGEKLYKVMGVVDKKRQAKVFGMIKTRLVFETEVTEVKEKVAKPLKGTPESRASDAVASLVERMKKQNDDMGALVVNERFTSNDHASCLFTKNGQKVLLSDSELELIDQLLEARGRVYKKAA